MSSFPRHPAGPGCRLWFELKHLHGRGSKNHHVLKLKWLFIYKWVPFYQIDEINLLKTTLLVDLRLHELVAKPLSTIPDSWKKFSPPSTVASIYGNPILSAS